MTTCDLVVRRGTIATAADTSACDIGIRDGRIAALDDDHKPAGELIDATGEGELAGDKRHGAYLPRAKSRSRGRKG